MKSDTKRRIIDEAKLLGLLVVGFGVVLSIPIYLAVKNGDGTFNDFLAVWSCTIVVIALLTRLTMNESIGGMVMLSNPRFFDTNAFAHFFKSRGGKNYAGITVVPEWMEVALQKLFHVPVGNIDGLTNYIAENGKWFIAQPIVAPYPRDVLDGSARSIFFVRAARCYTVYAVKLPTTFPKMIFDFKSNKKTHFEDYRAQLATDDLVLCEGVFTKDCHVYSRENEQVEVLSIATPEVLIALRDHSEGADVFVMDEWLYFVYDRKLAPTTDELERLVSGAAIIERAFVDNIPRKIKPTVTA